MRTDEEKVSNFRVLDHVLVPKHEVLKVDESKQILEIYNAKPEQFPFIMVSDPVVREIGAKVGDIVKITRKSQTAGETIYYRFVVEG